MAEYLDKEDMNTGEYISRDDTLKAIHQYCKDCDNCNGVMCRACDSADAMDIIIDMPRVDVQLVKRGHWITNPYMLNRQKCSECGFWSDDLQADNYCPSCGADMRGEPNE